MQVLKHAEMQSEKRDVQSFGAKSEASVDEPGAALFYRLVVPEVDPGRLSECLAEWEVQ